MTSGASQPSRECTKTPRTKCPWTAGVSRSSHPDLNFAHPPVTNDRVIMTARNRIGHWGTSPRSASRGLDAASSDRVSPQRENAIIAGTRTSTIVWSIFPKL